MLDCVKDEGVLSNATPLRCVRCGDNDDNGGHGDDDGNEGGNHGLVTFFQGSLDLNLLDLRNGVSAQLAQGNLPPGSYSLIRL